MNGPTWIFCAKLTPFSLQTQEQCLPINAAAKLSDAQINSAAPGTFGWRECS
jgi:hypothetical protein